MVDKALFSSDSGEWETPQWLYDLLDREFHFTLDPCATDENAKAPEFFTKEENGLAQSWRGDIVFVNPPFPDVTKWVKKSYEESLSGATVVVLLAARTDTAMWHDYVMLASELRLIRGRLHFVGAESSAPFPSVVVIFRPGMTELEPFLGAVIDARGH